MLKLLFVETEVMGSNSTSSLILILNTEINVFR